MTSPRLSTRSGTLLCFINFSCSNYPLVCSLGTLFHSACRAKVQVGGSRSLSFRIRQGVPQGLVLGPVLFILFVDDITKDLSRGAHDSLYADDLAMRPSSPDPLKASSVVHSSLNVPETWSNLWRLPLNRVLLFLYRSPSSHFPALLYILGIPLWFNPTPKFLGVIFDRTLSFGAHVQSLCSKFYPRQKALRFIATASWGPMKESLSLLHKAFVRPVLTYASPGSLSLLHKAFVRPVLTYASPGCSHSFSTPQPITWKSYTELHAGLLLGASLPPPSLLLLEAQLPPLKLTLEHQPLSSFERALRLPQTSPAFMPW